MIIYIFNELFFNKIKLPNTVSGMYPIYIENKLIGNVIAKDDAWIINLDSDFISKSDNKLYPFKIYDITSTDNKDKFNLVAIPKCDENIKVYKVNSSLLVGNTNDCDIYYNPNANVSNNNQKLLLTKINNNQWQIQINILDSNFFINDHRAFNGETLLCGDYIFYFGLKIILIGSVVMISNPFNEVRINSQKLLILAKTTDYVKKEEEKKDKEYNLYDKNSYFYKSPRFNFIIEEENFNIDEPPAPIKLDETPMILVIGPQLTMVSTSILSIVTFINNYMSGNMKQSTFIISLSTMSITVLGSLLWPTLIRRYNNKKRIKLEKIRKEKYIKYLEKKEEELELIKANQLDIILTNHPSYDKCLKIIENKSKELWQRSIEHSDFLCIRLGIGSVNTKIKINHPIEKFSIEEEDELFTKMKDIVNKSLIIKDVPITYTFTKNAVNSIVGPTNLVKEFLDSIFLQMITFHSYTDLKIIVFTKEEKKWDYLKVVPHCWNNQKNLRYFTTNIEDLSFICNDLEKVFDSRKANDESIKIEDNGEEQKEKNNAFTNYRPYYLFFVDDMTSIRNVSLINKILYYKQNLGFSILVTSESISNLPSETTDFICVSEGDSAVMTSQISDNQKLFKADFIKADAINIHKYASMLANIPIPIEKEKYELPSSLSFLELYNVGRVEQLNSLERWQNNNPVLNLSVPIGIDQNGEVFKMDIHEKAYGPHGLVAGTTGSGKSEWIVTYILSLAVNYSPEEVQFVLIDYKGGGLAKSFENSELGIKLPHLAGTVTNLEKYEIFRVIQALESELKRRQQVFNEVRETLKEGSMNIYKYQQYYRKGLVSEPMSHLLIICDEFAELKSQQPEFMDQLISTSRIGRSLGIHLILATQKPSGVVNDQIWSNSKFKVCLKVQDKSDSNEILKKPDAAFLKQTGAFYLQVGNDDYYNLGQAAWAGAKYYPKDKITKQIDDSIKCIDNVGRYIGEFSDVKNIVKDNNNGEELFNIVSYVSSLSKIKEMKYKTLWLDNISSNIYLADLLKKYNYVSPGKFNYNIVIGEYDDPSKQKQGLLELNLEHGNIAIIGQNALSNEKLLSTIIWSTITLHTPYEIAFYMIDFGTETFKKFSKFPHVGEVLFQEDKDSIQALFEMIYDEVDKRKNLLSDYNGSFTYYNKVSENKLPLISLCINDFDIFNETFPKFSEQITILFRDASKYGIIFIIVGNSTSSVRTRQLQYFNHTIVTNLNDDTMYRNIVNCQRGLVPKTALGRGICRIDESDNSSYKEFQTAFISTEENELNVIKSYAEKCMDYYKYKVKQVAKIPDDVSSSDLIKYATNLSEVPIGYNFYDKNISKYDFLSKKIHLITGKSINSYMPFVYALTTILSNISDVKVRVLDLSNIFKEPILDIKLFNDNYDVVFAALEKDCLTRSESQNYGVNIILGIGSYKRKLSKGGLEIFNNLFANINNSKKTVYIFVDDYETLRTLKIDNNFKDVDFNCGLWLGQNVSNQSLIGINEVLSEDKKYNYKGLAYKITNKEYDTIKVMMDGDSNE